MAIDFLLMKPMLTRRHNMVAVEVKSIRDYSPVSPDKFAGSMPSSWQSRLCCI